MIENHMKNGGFISPNTAGGNYNSNTMHSFFCGQCGSQVNNSDIYCRNCGSTINNSKYHSFDQQLPINKIYYQNGYQQQRVLEKSTSDKQFDWKTIFKGVFLIIGLSFVLGFFMGIFLFNAPVETIIAVSVILNILSLFIGGLYVGSNVISNGGKNGLFVGVFCVIISEPFNLLMGLPFDLVAIIGAMIFSMIITGLGGFIGSKIGKPRKTYYKSAMQANYG